MGIREAWSKTLKSKNVDIKTTECQKIQKKDYSNHIGSKTSKANYFWLRYLNFEVFLVLSVRDFSYIFRSMLFIPTSWVGTSKVDVELI